MATQERLDSHRESLPRRPNQYESNASKKPKGPGLSGSPGGSLLTPSNFHALRLKNKPAYASIISTPRRQTISTKPARLGFRVGRLKEGQVKSSQRLLFAMPFSPALPEAFCILECRLNLRILGTFHGRHMSVCWESGSFYFTHTPPFSRMLAAAGCG